MPIYEYVCSECGQPTELLQKMSDPPATDCPNCGQPGLSKQVSAAGFRLNGGGWYETDFKSGNKKNLAGSESGSSAAGGGDKAATPAAAAPASAATSSAAAPATPAKSEKTTKPSPTSAS